MTGYFDDLLESGPQQQIAQAPSSTGLFDDLLVDSPPRADGEPRRTGYFDDLLTVPQPIAEPRQTDEPRFDQPPRPDPTLGEQFRSGVETLGQGLSARLFANTQRQLEAFDRIERGERVSIDDDPIGYQDQSPEQRQESRRRAEEAGARALTRILESQRRQESIPRVPEVEAAISAANEGRWSDAWRIFASRPGGVMRQLVVESLPQQAPSLLLGGAGGALLGRVGAAVGALGGGHAAEMGPRIVDNIRQELQQRGVDWRDDDAVRRALAADRSIAINAARDAGAEAIGPAIGDALSMGLAVPLRAGRTMAGTAGRAAGAVAANTAIEGVGESGGEALAQVIEGRGFRPGEIVAEGLAGIGQGGPTTIAGTLMDRNIRTPRTTQGARDAQATGAQQDAGTATVPPPAQEQQAAQAEPEPLPDALRFAPDMSPQAASQTQPAPLPVQESGPGPEVAAPSLLSGAPQPAGPAPVTPPRETVEPARPTPRGGWSFLDTQPLDDEVAQVDQAQQGTAVAGETSGVGPRDIAETPIVEAPVTAPQQVAQAPSTAPPAEQLAADLRTALAEPRVSTTEGAKARVLIGDRHVEIAFPDQNHAALFALGERLSAPLPRDRRAAVAERNARRDEVRRLSAIWSPWIVTDEGQGQARGDIAHAAMEIRNDLVDNAAGAAMRGRDSIFSGSFVDADRAPAYWASAAGSPMAAMLQAGPSRSEQPQSISLQVAPNTTVELELTPQVQARAPAILREVEAIARRKTPAGTTIGVATRLTEKGESGHGMYVPALRQIWVALNAIGENGRFRTAAEIRNSVNHEVIHAIRHLFRPHEWQALKNRAISEWMNLSTPAGQRYNIRARYSNLTFEQQIEEAIAEAFADWAGGRRVGVTGVVLNVFNRIAEFFRAVNSWLRGQGITSPEQVFRRVESGQVARRQDGMTVGEAAPAALFQTPPAQPPENKAKNLENAQQAMERVLAGEDVVPNAAWHPKIGWIAFVWKRVTGRDPDGKLRVRGLEHARDERMNETKQDMTEAKAYEFLRKIPEIIVNGIAHPPYWQGTAIMRNITWLGNTIVVEQIRNGERTDWVYTAFPPKPQDKQLLGQKIGDGGKAVSVVDQDTYGLRAGAAGQGSRAFPDATQARPSTQPTARPGIQPTTAPDGTPTNSPSQRDSRSGLGAAPDENISDPGPEDNDDTPKLQAPPALQAASVPPKPPLPQAIRRATYLLKEWWSAPKLPSDPDWNRLSRTVLHPASIAAADPHFAPVFAAATTMMERRSRAATLLAEIASPYFKLGATDKAQVNKVLELGRLQGRDYSADRNIVAVNDIGGPNDPGGIANVAMGETVRLSPEQAEGYRAVRKMFDRAIEMFRQQFLIEQGFGKPGDPRTAKQVHAAASQEQNTRERQRLNDIADVLGEIEQAKRIGYVPFSRFGNIAVVVKDRLGAVAHFETFETGLKHPGSAARVARRVEELKRIYPTSKGFQVGRPYRTAPRQISDLGDIDFGMIDDVARRHGVGEDATKQVVDALRAEFSKAGFRKHFINSRNTPGYTTDFERAIADYLVGISGYLARRGTIDQFEDAVAGIPQAKPGLKTYARTYQDYVMSPQEEAQTWRNWMFFAHLAGNVSSAVVNLTQVPMWTAPFVSMFAGHARITREFGRAYLDTLKMFSPERKADALNFDIEKAPADVRDALREMLADGTLVPQATLEQMGVASGRSRMLRGASAKARTLLELAGTMFSAAERMNRIVTAIAVLRMGRDPVIMAKANAVFGDKTPGRGNERWKLIVDPTPQDLARLVVDETHLIQGKVNRPTMMRHHGTWIFQFKNFTSWMLQLQYQMATRYGEAGRKAFMLNVAALFIATGLFGLTLGDNIKDLIEHLWGKSLDLEKEIQSAVRGLLEPFTGTTTAEYVAESVRRGVIRPMGVDVSQRIDMGRVVPMQTIRGMLGDDSVKAEQAFSDLGVPGSVVGRVLDAASLMRQGLYLRGLQEFAPFFGSAGAGNLIRAAQMAGEGTRSRQGQIVVPSERIAGSDIALRALGFQSSPLARTFETQRMIERARGAAESQRREYVGRLARAMNAGDQIEVARLNAEIDRYNEGRPLHEQVIVTPQALRQATGREREGMDARNRNLPRRVRPEAERIREIMPPAR